jgi:serine/threonine protein kinase
MSTENQIAMELPTGTILAGKFKLMELTQSHPILGRTYNAINQQGEGFIVRVDKEENALSLVRTEATFLQEVKKLNAEDRFVQLVHGASYKQQIYFVTRFRPGPTLNQCLGAMPEGKFTVGTATRCAHQVLRAVEIIHSMNCLFRRIDPNVIRFDAETRSIFLSDMSSVRINPASVNSDVEVRWAGAQIYAPLIHHSGGSVSSRHDIEALIYLLVDMTTGYLPWESSSADSIRSVKRQTSTDQSLFNGCPPQYGSIFMYISCLDDSEPIDYEKIYRELEETWKHAGVKDLAEKYDFEALMCTEGEN